MRPVLLVLPVLLVRPVRFVRPVVPVRPVLLVRAVLPVKPVRPVLFDDLSFCCHFKRLCVTMTGSVFRLSVAWWLLPTRVGEEKR